MIVVKVGGSLFDHPRLVLGLRKYLITLRTEEVWLVPGGGSVVEAIRKLNAIHQLGEEASHWLALQALEVTGEFVKQTIAPGERSGLSRPSAYLEDDDWESLVPNDEDETGELPSSEWSASGLLLFLVAQASRLCFPNRLRAQRVGRHETVLEATRTCSVGGRSLRSDRH